ncbi:MAG: Sua5/YciO/YrdC/YwlC family protein [Zetaproteobacteria bacterium]|nr:Sua5/YciO/YrdC/YwlC family protein [Zetaproteobacteria bacterium]
MLSHVYTYENPLVQKHLDAAIEVLDNQGVLCLPSSSGWIFGCDSAHSKAATRLRELKPEHPKTQPFSLLCADFGMASQYAHIDNASYRLMKKLSNGWYTFFLPATLDSPKKLKDKRKRVGVRIPQQPLLCGLTRQFARPIAITSFPAVFEGEVFGYQIAEVYAHRLTMILDLGEPIRTQETTIVDLTGSQPCVLRLGTQAELSSLKEQGLEWHVDEGDHWSHD